MKAITIWQPWASLLACGAKEFETRSWAATYRGPMAIHASKKPFDTDQYLDRELRSFANALELPDIHSFGALPCGCIIAVAELTCCHEIVLCGGRGLSSDSAGWLETDRGIYHPTKLEQLFGDWRRGRYAWELTNIKALRSPVPARGRLGLWDLTAEEERAVHERTV